MNIKKVGNEMYRWASDLFPITRSITGPGFRETLNYIKNIIPDLKIYEVASGTQVYDWIVPDEWSIREAWIEHESGEMVLDFKNHNLHVVGYSIPVDTWLTLDSLQEFLHSRPDLPDAIPFVTSYYARRWGFCLTHRQRTNLKPGKYHVRIDSTLEPGFLNYGELIIKGDSKEELMLSTYICHPSMGNNELSGPVVTTALARWIQGLQQRRFTYRIVFCPETIGSVVYVHKNFEHLKKSIIAGFVVTCVGDDKHYSYLPSRLGNTLADRVAKHTLRQLPNGYKEYSFLDRGSDERQYCAPGVDLPVCSIMRSKYREYPEYHTSLDDMNFISAEGLEGSYKIFQQCLQILEANYFWKNRFICEPQLSKRGLYATLSQANSTNKSTKPVFFDILAYADGNHDLLAIADRINLPAWRVSQAIEELKKHGIVELSDSALP